MDSPTPESANCTFIILTPVTADRAEEIWNEFIAANENFTRIDGERCVFGYDIADYDKSMADLEVAGVRRSMDFQMQCWADPIQARQAPYCQIVMDRDGYFPLMHFLELPGSTMSLPERREFCNFFMHLLHGAGIQSSLLKFDEEQEVYYLEPQDALLAMMADEKKNTSTKHVASASMTMCISIPGKKL